MKNKFVIILFLTTIFSVHAQEKKDDDIESYKFIGFLYSFSQPDSQITKIKFPIEYILINDSLKSSDTTIFNQNDWLEKYSNQSIRITGLYSYTNEQQSINKTDHILLEVQQYDSYYEYYFERLIKSWFLVKVIKHTNVQSTNLNNENSEEKFHDFIQLFTNDTVFRRKRIIFPLELTTCPDMDKDTTIYLTIEEAWFIYNEWPNIYTIYDNYKKLQTETKYRFLYYAGGNNGISYGHKFKRIKNKWYWISTWDRSN